MNRAFKNFAAAGLLTMAGLLALAVAPASAAEPLKIGVSSGPYGEILEFAAKTAAKEGLEVKVVEFTDWNMLNAALSDGDIDANNFQHVPYLNNQIKQRGYDLVPVADSIVVPMGLYSSKVTSADDIKQGATVAIPNDPTNAARALFLIEKAGLVTLRDGVGLDASLADINDNPRKLKFIELDAAQLPRSLDDVQAAIITLNYAVLAGLDPKKSLVLEDEKSKWNLVWVARRDRAEDARIKRYIEIYRSPETREFVLERFKGTILPTW
ncbi:methionine ABC transporter substrate-binding protein [Skermanella stibiiresistens SB22]|uniref:Lipoprotein n=1 Tax=Skermanella stibiiresistens SB22 TaxID=1385369 RepID=W9H2C6_9PROT|nr:MetQ/NlpA family ABC transporter substrate-binding protein [Skermanella stibiiresistens]EWY37918.1 methionine ABC transporter substrate-binding protein [Skermanella stibiiresistens SB22]